MLCPSEDKIEWDLFVGEYFISDMGQYFIRTTEIDKSEREEVVREIARAVLSSSRRDVSKIHIEAMDGLEKKVEFKRLQNIKNIEYKDNYLDETFEATPEAVDAVLNLFSTPLIRAIFYDSSDTPIFARHEMSSIKFDIDEDTFAEVSQSIGDKSSQYIEESNLGGTV